MNGPLGGSLRQPSTQQQTSQCEPRDENGQDENKKEKIIPFLQLGRLVPYSDRKNMLSDKGTFCQKMLIFFFITSNRRTFFFPETENLNFGD
jgi:hypothetical protein